MSRDAPPGRNCPLSYRYPARVFGRAAELAADTLWIAGGLYGNPFALERLLERYDAERGEKALVFNGDFHWFDAEPTLFGRIDHGVLAHRALRGNVETELVETGFDAGCGCAYPEWVDEGTVARSNAIMKRLRAAASDAARLAALPMHLVAQVGEARVGIVHGDAGSLAGWSFSQENLGTSEGASRAEKIFREANVDVFASSHTCLPVLQGFGGERAIVNNGAAGMPNFQGERYGVVTRISLFPNPTALYGVALSGLHIEAIALRYDHEAWERMFLDLWPAGSAAHQSYYGRIVKGPSYTPAQALRAALRQTPTVPLPG